MSWRVTRRCGRSDAAPCAASRRRPARASAPPPILRPWLEHLHGDAAGRRSTRRAPAADRRLRALPRPRRRPLGAAAHAGVRRLPEHPRAASRRARPALQELWNGTSGVALAAQSAAFYRQLRERFGRARRRGRSPTRACSTSAAAGAGSPASSRATSRPGACMAAIRSSRSSTSAATAGVPAVARSLRLRPRAASVRRAVRPRLRLLGLHPPLRGRARALPRGAARRAARRAASSS